MNFRQKHLNHELKKIGFGGIDDPQLIHQLAFCVRDHEHFRKVLLAVGTGEQRKIAYDTMRPHLNFEAKPLDWYILKGKEEAEELQLPIQNPDGSFTPYKDYHGEKPSLEVMAEKAMAEAPRLLADPRDPKLQIPRLAKAKMALKVICGKCTRVDIFPGLDRIAAYAFAQKSGWVFEEFDGEEKAVCPQCPAIRSEVAHA